MLKLLIKSFFFWRRNDAASIVFKTIVLTGLVFWPVSIFAPALYAAVAGAAAGLLIMVKSVIRNRREHAKLLKHFKGDREKLALFRKKFMKGGVGGALVMEMLRAEGDIDDEDYVEETLSDEQRAENRAASEARLERALAIVDAHPELAVVDREERLTELRESFADGEDVHDIQSLLPALLPERALSFAFEDYCNDDDHAWLVTAVADATLGAWMPTNCTSSCDETGENYTVRFVDAGEEQAWGFYQSGDWLNENFLCKLFAYAQERSGQRIETLCSEDYFEGIVLPAGVFETLTTDPVAEAA